MDRHLNLFVHYDQEGAMPIENNVTRGLGIILQENPSVLFLLLNKIKECNKELQNLPFPTDSYTVNLQVPPDKFDPAQYVVGITLTVDNDWTAEPVGNVDGNRGLTDISIAYDDTLIIVEVKRTNEDCRDQLQRYINAYISSQKANSSEVDNIKCGIVNFVWTDVIAILKNMQKLIQGDNRIIDDYLELLQMKYPKWFPVPPLSQVEFENTAILAGRMTRVKEEYIKKFGKNSSLVYSRKAIPVDFRWASEISLEIMEDDFAFSEKIKEKYLKVGMWPADTGGQLWELLKATPELKFARKRFSKLELPTDATVEVRVWPYIKFCHFNRGVEWLFWDKEKTNIDLEETAKFAHQITRRWTSSKTGSSVDNPWSSLKQAIYDEKGKLFNEEDIKKFNREFAECFEQTNRNYANVSVGFEVYACIPYSTMQKYDNNVDDYSNVVDYLHTIITALRDFVVSK